jgi:hypothetical protein
MFNYSPNWFSGKDSGCKQISYDHVDNEAADNARRVHIDILQLETPGYDHQERREPKTGLIANVRNRPIGSAHEQAIPMNYNAGESAVDIQSKHIDRQNEAAYGLAV